MWGLRLSLPFTPASNSFPHLRRGYPLSATCMLGTGLPNSDTKIHKITFPVFKEQENHTMRIADASSAETAPRTTPLSPGEVRMEAAPRGGRRRGTVSTRRSDARGGRQMTPRRQGGKWPVSGDLERHPLGVEDAEGEWTCKFLLTFHTPQS